MAPRAGGHLRKNARPILKVGDRVPGVVVGA
jgi:hypothetical protein